jgi:hypothetical protein
MVNILRAMVGLTLATLVACGGTSRRNQTPGGSGDGGTGAGVNSGGQAEAGRGEGGSTVSGSGGNAAGSGGNRIINGEPDSCTTSAGELGMVIDIFPYPLGVPECLALDHPGDEDPNCPGDSLYVCDPIDCYSAVDMPGCCRPDGMCGLLEKGYFSFERKLGCVSRDPWIENEEFLGRKLEPVSCTP